VDSSGNVYVADTGNHRIQKFTGNGAFIIEWGNQGEGNSQFDSPYKVTADKSGSVFVADTDNHRIQKFTSGGVFVREWGGWGSGNTQFAYPGGVAVDADGAVYVSSDSNQDHIVLFYTDRIQKFTGHGEFVTKWHGFDYPEGLTVDEQGQVYVADSGNNRVSVFARSPTYEVYLPLVVRRTSG
jgi:DNA-binding beta-propeller fold protein YncE